MRARIAGLAWLLAALSISGRVAGDDGSEPGAAPPKTDPSVLTVERIFDPDHNGGPLTGPLLDGVAWRPKHDEWTEWRGKKEERALWLVDAETGKERRLVGILDFDEWKPPKDARPEVGMRGIGRAGPPSYVWAPTGDAVFVTLRGDVFRFDVATGTKVRCTQTKSPISDLRIAPDGLKLSFCRDHDLWAVVIKLAEVKVPMVSGWAEPTVLEIRLTTGGSETIRNGDLDWVYPEELGCETAAWWSPDSTRVAFLQLDETKVSKFPIADYMPRLGSVEYEFYPKAGDANPVPRVGVVGLDGKPPAWMRAPGTEDGYVPWLVWIPDARHLLAGSLSRDQQQFELGAFDIADGSYLPFAGGSGKPAWVDLPSRPTFLAEHAAFLWTERVFADDADRVRLSVVRMGEPSPPPESLTPADQDVARIVGADETMGSAYYEAEGRSGLTTSVWRTSRSRAPPVRLTDDAASHHASFSDSAKWFLDTESRASVPPKITLRKADGTAVRVVADSMTPQYAALKLEPPEFGRVPAKGDLPDLMYSLRKPKAFDPAKKYPVIVHTYGGPGARLVRDEFGGGDFFNALLAQEGFAVFTLDNRGSGGRGKSFETPIYKRLGTVELEDQLRGVEWLKTQPWVDGSRIGIWGWSYGGYMTCYAMTRAPDVFKAGVAVAPVTDWRLYDTIYTERYMGLPKDNEEGYKNSSPITFAKDLKGALLFCHGLSDDNVHVQNTLQFAEALIQAGKKFDLMLYPHRHHGIEGAEAHVDVFRRILEHFRNHL